MTIPAHIAQTLTDLRLRRDMLNDAIHVLSTIWEAPAVQSPVRQVTETVAMEPPRQRKQLKPVHVARAPRAGGAGSEADDNAVLSAVRKLGRATKASVIAATKLAGPRVQRAKVRLENAGALVVVGRARAARWSLPGTSPAKEAP